MSEYEGPLPKPDKDSEVYWEGARRHELLLQRCGACQKFRFYPRSVCPFCLSDTFEWTESTGRGTVYSFTVIHRAPSRAFQGKVPYVLALIELDEGIRMMSNVVDTDPAEVRIGMRVEVVFDDVTSEVTLPKFRPLNSN
jgi:uncharacterized OB-fold protein